MTTAEGDPTAAWTPCTITTKGSMSTARLLQESLEVQGGGGAPLVALVADDLDGEVSGADEPFTVVGIDEIGLDDAQLRSLATLYEVAELTHVLRPWLVDHLLGSGASAVVVLDDSVEVGGSLDPLAAAVGDHAVALVPGARPELVNPYLTGGDSGLVRGAYDARAIAFGASGRDVLAWWRDLVLGGFTHTVGDGPTAEERMLAVVPARFDAVVVHELAPGCLGATPPVDSPPSRLERLSDGTVVDLRMRVLYREALNEHLAGRGPAPPTPFDAQGEDAFWHWLGEPWLPATSPRLSRYVARIWRESEALQLEYPDLGPETCEAFQHWVRANAADVVPAPLVPQADQLGRLRAERRRRRPVGGLESGVNVAGYLGAVLGLGEVGRVVEQALRLGGCATAIVDNPETASPRDESKVVTTPPDEAPFDVNLLVVTAEATATLGAQVGPSFFAGRRSIGLWFWEVDPFGHVPPAALDLVDEIWAPSAFVHHALRGVRSPIVPVPIPVPIPAVPEGIDRRALGLPPDAFLFAFTYDFLSIAKRKNPYGVVDAFCRAFDVRDEAALVLKSINGRFDPDGLARLRREAEGRRDVIVIDEHFPAPKQAALIGACDAYVSLHRSEGFGLTMAEAMALGKPVIATGYSGNLDFMTDDVGYLVRYDECPVGDGADPYPPDARWAEPDLDHAASLMRRVFDEREEAHAVGERAAAHIRANHSLEAVAPALARLAAETHERLADAPATWRNHFMAGWRTRARPDLHRYYEYDWLPDGTPVDDTMQRTFTDALDRARRGEDVVPPSPDVPGGADAVLAWLNEPVVPKRRPVVSRYLRRYWADHPDLQARFADLEDRKVARAYLDWVRERWHADTDIWWRLVPGR